MKITKTMVTVTHIEVRSGLSAEHVHTQLVATLPKLDPALVRALQSGSVAEVAKLRRDGPPLWLFEVRDMGSLLAVEGQAGQVYQYEIGNPLTAESMVRYKSAAGLYAPLRVVLYAEGSGCVLAYDRPSDLFGQYGDDRVTTIGGELDRELDAALWRALRDE